MGGANQYNAGPVAHHGCCGQNLISESHCTNLHEVKLFLKILFYLIWMHLVKSMCTTINHIINEYVALFSI